MKNNLIFLFTLILLLCLIGCTSSETKDTQERTESVSSEPQKDTQEKTEFVSPDPQAMQAADAMVFDFLGQGSINVQIREIHTFENWESLDIGEAALIPSFPLAERGAVLTVDFVLTNVDYSAETEDSSLFLVNRLGLVASDWSLKKKDEEPLDANSPVYFDKHKDLIKEYFYIDLPHVGDSKEFILGWQLSGEEAELLESGQLSLIDCAGGGLDAKEIVLSPQQFTGKES